MQMKWLILGFALLVVTGLALGWAVVWFLSHND